MEFLDLECIVIGISGLESRYALCDGTAESTPCGFEAFRTTLRQAENHTTDMSQRVSSQTYPFISAKIRLKRMCSYTHTFKLRYQRRGGTLVLVKVHCDCTAEGR